MARWDLSDAPGRHPLGESHALEDGSLERPVVSSQDQAQPDSRISSWLRYVFLGPVLFALLYACGFMGMLAARQVTSADTRSGLIADYSPWPFTIIRPVRPELAQEVLNDQARYPGIYPASPFIAPTPSPTSITATASPSPRPNPSATTTATLSWSPSPSPSLTMAFASSPSPTIPPTHTLTPHAAITATRTVAPPPSATATPSRTSPAPSDWYNANWPLRKKITIHANRVAGNLAGFPVLISLGSDADLAARAQDDGDDILFTAANGTTKLSHEVETFDGGNGRLVAWVKIPSLSASSDTILFMYYGNAATSSQQDAAGVWVTNYEGVWHLGEAVTDNASARGVHRDSTSNGNNGDQVNNNDVTGKIGSGQEFEGDVQDEYIEIPNSASLENVQEGDYTLEAWFNSDATPPGVKPAWNAYYGIVIKRSHHIGLRFRHDQDFASDHYLAGLVEVWVDGDVKNNNQWYHVVGVVDRTNGTHKIYVNGVNEDTNTFTAGAAANEYDAKPWRIGIADTGRVDWAWPANGKIDEVRISSTVRSSEWIVTEFNNQSTPSTFYVLGAQEAFP